MKKNLSNGLKPIREVTIEQLTRSVRKVFQDCQVGPFKPVAYYDSMLDDIRVITADCSMTEVQLSPMLNLFERNYIEDGQARYVGFSIEAVKSFCGDVGIPTNTEVRISTILRLLRRKEKVPRKKGAITEVMLPLLKDHNLDYIKLSD